MDRKHQKQSPQPLSLLVGGIVGKWGTHAEWAIHHEVPVLLQSYLADAHAEHLVRQAQYAFHAQDKAVSQDYCQRALKWIDISKTLLHSVQSNERNYIRKCINTEYQEAIVLYRIGNSDKAELLFRSLKEDCDAIGWQRLSLYVQNWLADVAIQRGTEANLAEAESFLPAGLPIVERNKDRRRIAFYYWSLAQVEVKRNKTSEAKGWAKEAIDVFQRLGMLLEVEEIERFRRTVGDSQSSYSDNTVFSAIDISEREEKILPLLSSEIISDKVLNDNNFAASSDAMSYNNQNALSSYDELQDEIYQVFRDEKKVQAFSVVLSTYMKNGNVNQKDLASSLYVDPSTISYWCSGHRLPDITTALRITEVLDLEEKETKELLASWFFNYAIRGKKITGKEAKELLTSL